MKENPILFSGSMVRAILDGRKTQTRRIVKATSGPHTIEQTISSPDSMAAFIRNRCPYGQPGDRMWVRESFQPLMADGIPESEWLSCDYKTGNGYKISYPATDGIVEYYNIATDDAFCNRVTPSIFMPRWASRITLEIVNVRVERLQEISVDDAIAEGMTRSGPHRHGADGLAWEDHPGHVIADPYASKHNTGAFDCPLCPFIDLWDSINTKSARWASNPWVWVIEFRKLLP